MTVRPKVLSAAPMSRFMQSVFALMICVLVLSPGQSLAADPVIETKAQYAILMEAQTGLVLFEKQADEPMAPASMSKLMTLTMVFERLKEGTMSLDDEIYISEEAWRRGGTSSGSSTMFLEVGSRVPVRDLLRGITIQSGNDACIALAEAIGGTEGDFAAMMTRRAPEIGLTGSTFVNSTGWPDPNHRMTARDLALLARHIIMTYPEYYHLFSEQSFTWNGISQSNRNPLIYSFDGADGLKTGHTEASGYGLVGSAERGGRRFVMVFNGLTSERERSREAQRLMTMAFTSFTYEPLFNAGDQVGISKVFQGQEANVPLVVDREMAAWVHRSARRKLTVTLQHQEPLLAPITQGQEVGRITVSAPGLPVQTAPIYAGADVAETGFFGKVLIGLEHLIFGPDTPEGTGEEPSGAEASAQ